MEEGEGILPGAKGPTSLPNTLVHTLRLQGVVSGTLETVDVRVGAAAGYPRDGQDVAEDGLLDAGRAPGHGRGAAPARAPEDVETQVAVEGRLTAVAPEEVGPPGRVADVEAPLGTRRPVPPRPEASNPAPTLTQCRHPPRLHGPVCPTPWTFWGTKRKRRK